MIKFYYANKLKYFISSIIILKYTLWFGFLTLQGKAIHLAIEMKHLHSQLIYTLVEYVAIKLTVMLCDVFIKFLTDYYKNKELKQQWDLHVPRTLYHDNKNDYESINILIFDNFPRLFDLKIATIANKITVVYIFTLTLMAFVYNGFYVALLALIVIFSLNYISKNIFVTAIDTYHLEAHNNKIAILNWLGQYFSSYREISKNWPGIIHSNWQNSIYNKYAFAKNKQISFYFYRDLLSQLLVEFPFLMNSSVVIVGVSQGYLSLAQLFIWMGFSQFMITASNAYLENRINQHQIKTLTLQIQATLNCFKSASANIDSITFVDLLPSTQITLKDGSHTFLSIQPGIYHIHGNIGSGKTTLLNILLNYERDEKLFNYPCLAGLKKSIKQDSIRVIEREAVIFDCFDGVEYQVNGPLERLSSDWKSGIKKSLNTLLPPVLATRWMHTFNTVAGEYQQRPNKIMSSGEKIIFSIMRFFSSWNSGVSVLVVDECDSFLDHDKKALFIETITCLSAYMAVYISSHDQHFRNLA